MQMVAVLLKCLSPSLNREGSRCAEMAMVCLTDFEEYAKEHLSKATWDYYAAGADECCTRDDNLLAYKRYSVTNGADEGVTTKKNKKKVHNVGMPIVL